MSIPNFLWILVQAVVVLSQFSYPPPGKVLFNIGEDLSIKYKTDWEEYTIALWQQSKKGGRAVLGPVVYRGYSSCLDQATSNRATDTKNGPSYSFKWTVQTYDFDLQDSEIFFFWVFEGDRSNQGNQTKKSMSSAYFRISEKLQAEETHHPASVEKSQKATSTTTSGEASSKVHKSSTTSLSEEEQSTTTSPEITSTSEEPTSARIASITSYTKNETLPTPTSKDGSSVLPITPSSKATSSDNKTDHGLSTGAKAGIGIGAGVGCIALLAGIMYLTRWMKIKREERPTTASSEFWCRGNVQTPIASPQAHDSVWRPWRVTRNQPTASEGRQTRGGSQHPSFMPSAHHHSQPWYPSMDSRLQSHRSELLG